MIPAPIREPSWDGRATTASWANYYQQINASLGGWSASASIRATLDFPVIAGQSQQALTVDFQGAKVGDSVQIYANDIPGIIYTSSVLSDGVVTIYAKNYTSANINPASTDFRIIVLQN